MHLPSRKAFQEIASCWEGLQPAAYIKNKSKKIGNLDTPEQAISFISAQQGSLKKHSEVKPIAEALEYLSDLASPASAFDLLNSTPRAVTDLQVFGEKGFYKNINRTSLALGQALQITQIYQGARSELEATERRDLISSFLKNPDLTKAVCLRIKALQKIEAQFLRQSKASFNHNLENKIEKLAPSKWFGKYRENASFMRWHAFFTQKTANWFFGYEHQKAMYLFSAFLTIVSLVLSKQSQTFVYDFYSALKNFIKRTNTSPQTGTGVASSSVSTGTTTPQDQPQVPPHTFTQQIRSFPRVMVQQYFERNPSGMLWISEKFYNRTLESPSKRAASLERLKDGCSDTSGLRMLADFMFGPLTGLFSGLGAATSSAAKTLIDPLKGPISSAQWKDAPLSSLTSLPYKSAVADFKKRFCENFGESSFMSWRMNGLDSLPKMTQEYILKEINENKDLAELFIIDKTDQTNSEQTIAHQLFKWVDPFGFYRYSDALQDSATPADGITNAAKKLTGAPDEEKNPFKMLNTVLNNLPGINNLLTGDLGQISVPALFSNPFTMIRSIMISPGANLFKLLFGYGGRTHWNWGFLGLRTRELLYALSNPFVQAAFKEKTSRTHEHGGNTYKITFAPNLFNLASLLRPAFYWARWLYYKSYITETPASRLSNTYNAERIIQARIAEDANKSDSLFDGCDLNAFKLFTVESVNADGSISTEDISKQQASEILLEAINTGKLQQLFQTRNTQGLTGDELAQALKHNQSILNKKLNWKKFILGLEVLALVTIFVGSKFWSTFVFGAKTKVEMYDVLDKYMFESVKPSIMFAELTRQISGIFKNNSHDLPLPTSLREKFAHIAHTSSKECQEFSLIAQNSLFFKDTHPGTFGDVGSVRRAYQLLKRPDVKEWVATCATIIAELDSYTGMARLVVEHKDIQNPYAPVRFVDQEKPFVHLENFWFPLLNPYLQKSNSLTLGTLEDASLAEYYQLTEMLPPSALITGINGSGKSIVLKGIIWAIMMAKTFGYAPLTNGVMTFIDKMIVHLSSTDNAAEGESCWIAEAKAMGQAIHTMQSPRQGYEKILFIGDELGSGTADHASIASVAQLIEIAVSTPHVACIVTTHLRILTELERISKGRILNYCVGKRLLPDGSIEGRFMLQRGRAENNIAEKIVNDLLHKGHIDITDPSESSEETWEDEKSAATEILPEVTA